MGEQRWPKNLKKLNVDYRYEGKEFFFIDTQEEELINETFPILNVAITHLEFSISYIFLKSNPTLSLSLSNKGSTKLSYISLNSDSSEPR